MKSITRFFLAILIAWLFWFCKSTTQNGSGESPFLNVRDSVAYVGMATCRECHSDVHQTFIHTGMGRSFDLATMQKSAADYGKHALVYDTINDLFYHPFFRDSTLYVLEYRLEKGDTVHQRLEKISYIVGSGQHTNSHLIDINGYLTQAPITYYTQEKRWDMAPGFRENNSRFGRWLTSECVTCHNHYPTQVSGSLSKFSAMPQGIECERCHGPGKLHVEKIQKGEVVDISKAADYSIVNPRRLSRDLQMDLCQRCHLQGVAVLEEGKSFYDFKPGMKLSEVLNVFLPRYTDTHEQFIMASQADRFRMSECFKNSENLSCLTCHNPHVSVEATGKTHYNRACLGCHQPAACLGPAHERASLSDDCVKCHMPRSGSIDIPHVHITDHFISKKIKNGSVPKTNKAFLGIQILTKDNPTPLDMARGYLATFEKYIPSPVMLDSASWYLNRSVAPFSERFPVLVNYLFNRGDYAGLLKAAEGFSSQKSLDGWTAYRIGEAWFRQGNDAKALVFFEIAAAAYPLHLDFLEKKGMALLGVNKLPEAKTVFEKVLSENPERPVALCNLGYAEALSGQLDQAFQLYEKAIALDPDYAQALINKAAILMFRKKNAEAKKLLERVLKIDPGNGQAKEGLGRLGN